MMQTHPILGQKIIDSGNVARELAKTNKYPSPEFEAFFNNAMKIMVELIDVVERQDLIIKTFTK